MKALLAIFGIVVAIGLSGCVVSPAYPPAGASVAVYGEYPSYGYGYHPYGYYHWHHPYDRDHYFYRHHRDWD